MVYTVYISSNTTTMNEVLIYIRPSDNEDGYVWDVYENDQAYIDAESYDGGLCTGSFDDALDFAIDAIKTTGKIFIKD